MEEMTIQEKARRYDEASKWMANVYPTLSHEQQMEAEAFFPMFQESEDEKIRQYLLKLADRCPEDSIDFMGEVKKEDVIAWLKKQGEQKFADGTFVNMDDVREDFVQEVYRVLYADSTNDRANQIIDAFDNLPTVTIEKQGEQKLIDKIQLGKKYKCITSPRYSTFMTGKIYKPEDKFLCSLMNFCSDCFESIEDCEQKTTWSEEDTEREPDQKDETLTKLIEEIDRLDEERKQNTKYKSAKSGFAHTVRYFFLSNEIKTLGELLSLGRKHVARCRNIGKMTMWAIDKALENLYGITEW